MCDPYLLAVAFLLGANCAALLLVVLFLIVRGRT